MNPWMTLLLAGLFEVGFTTALKMEQKNKNWFWVFLACAWISFGFLAEAIKAIPLGTAYAVWTGIGAVGTLLVGQIFFRDRLRPAQLALVGVMIAAMVGLKVTT
ncbi:DMT family transporter [Deinococcus taklimakanensis]|uniref:DMT family transporter n=1 Tax=Deinococcus taklimakanensis TaxID=536443 RepID=A0ABW5NZ80_9DEIO